MRLFTETLLDDGMAGPGSIYPSTEFDPLLAVGDALVVSAECENVSGASPWLTVALEHSNDGEFWVPKQALINTAPLIAGTDTVLNGTDDTQVPTGAYARLRVTLGGSSPNARVRISACGRSLVASSSVLWQADFTGYVPGPLLVLPSSLTFARASSATVQTDAGVVVTAGIGNDVARVGSDGTHQGLVLEETRTNLIADARTLSGTNWVAGSLVTTTANYAAGPDGSVVAGRSQVTSGGYSNFQSFSIGTTGTYMLSEWVRQGGAASPFQLRSENSGVVTSGAVVSGTATSVWQRVVVAFSFTSGDSSFPVPVDARDNSSIGGLKAQAYDDVTDLYQFELGNFATEAIVTSGSTASRAGERLYLAAGGAALVDGGRLSLELRVQPKSKWAYYANAVRLWTNASGGDYAEVSPSTGVLTVSIGGSTNTTSAIAWSAGGTLEFFVAAGGGKAMLVSYRVNGGVTTACSITGSALGSLSVGGALDLLCNGTSNQFTAWVQRVRAWRSGSKPGWA